MVKFHKELVKKASHFYGQVKYDGTLNIVTQELQEVLEGIQNTARFRQLMHLEQVSVDEKMSILSEVCFKFIPKYTRLFKTVLTSG